MSDRKDVEVTKHCPCGNQLGAEGHCPKCGRKVALNLLDEVYRKDDEPIYKEDGVLIGFRKPNGDKTTFIAQGIEVTTHQDGGFTLTGGMI